MSEIGKNIKKIRLVKKMSQADFANIFDLARPSIGAYEEGRSEPKIDTIIQMAKYFNLSVDTLLTRELTVNDLLGYGSFKEKLDRAHNQEKSKKVAPRYQKLVKIDKHLDYIVNHKSSDFIQSLPDLYLPVSDKKTYRVFEMKDSTMEYNQQGIHHGDLLLCRLSEPEKIKAGKIYSVVSDESIHVLRLVDKKNKKYSFKPDDTNYNDRIISIDHILEIWEVVGAFSGYLQPPSTLEEKVMKLEKGLEEMRKKIGG